MFEGIFYCDGITDSTKRCHKKDCRYGDRCPQKDVCCCEECWRCLKCKKKQCDCERGPTVYNYNLFRYPLSCILPYSI